MFPKTTEICNRTVLNVNPSSLFRNGRKKKWRGFPEKAEASAAMASTDTRSLPLEMKLDATCF